MRKTVRPSAVNQRVRVPPDLREWVPEAPVALFVREVVAARELAAIFQVYEPGAGRGQPPSAPAVRGKRRVEAYCLGQPAARQRERAP